MGVEKWRGARYVGFEGSYGFGRDRVATGWQKASLRRLDEAASTPAEPVHTYRTREPLTPGEIAPVDVAIGPSATLFRPGETLRPDPVRPVHRAWGTASTGPPTRSTHPG